MHATRLRAARSAALIATLAAASLAAACTSDDDGRPPRPRGALDVRTHQRADAAIVGSDTLSDSVHVPSVLPEADGDAVVFTFADPLRPIIAGLAVTRRDSLPSLLWPDSVTAVWWTGPHAVAFTTVSGRGVYAVVDVHAAKATVTEDTVQHPPAPPPPLDRNDPAFVRAVKYLDSLQVQPAGQPQGSSLRYEVVALRVAPDGHLCAFYTVATDSAGRRSNPAWYALDVENGAVARIDEIVGPVTEMPESAAGWTADRRFLYAKGATIWEATVRPR